VPAETFVRVRDLPGGTTPHTIPCSVLPTVAAFSADGRLLAVGDNDGTVRLWDARAGVELLHWQAHKGTIRSLAFAGGGGVLACGVEGADVQLLDLDRLRERLAALGLGW